MTLFALIVLGVCLGVVTFPFWVVSKMRRVAFLESEVERSNTPVGDVLRLPGSALEADFLSHPPAGERIARIRDTVRDDHLNSSRARRPLSVRVEGQT